MSGCWPDGVLRAFLDRELPKEELAAVAAHLDQCPWCSDRARVLSARAGRVLELVAALAVPEAEAVQPVCPAPKPAGTTRSYAGRWAAAAAALAALWAGLALLMPKPVQAPLERQAAPMPSAAMNEKPPLPAVSAPEVPAPPQPLPVRTANRAVPRPRQRALRASPPHATLAGFVALDDDPIDAGVVMRVALAQGQMQADVLYGLDGRPRAIRLVNDAAGK
jgi:hypothetical protein